MSILLLALSSHIDVMINLITDFFSSAHVDDSRTIVQAKKPATPWNTIIELNLFFCGFASNESIVLKPIKLFYYNRIMLTKKNPIIIQLRTTWHGVEYAD